MPTVEKSITASQLRKMGDIGRCEILYGELVMMSPAGAEHGIVAMRIARKLAEFVDECSLGYVFAAETGFLLEKKPDLLRAADVAFVRGSRMPRGKIKSFLSIAPDIAVEVVSPDDSRRQVHEKVDMWLAHGTASVWVADPARMTISLHRTARPARHFTAGELFIDEQTLPGFVLPVNGVFFLP